MRNKKKKISAILTALVLIACLSACSGNGDTESIDDVQVNGITIKKYEESNGDTFFSILVNITNHFDYDCDDISVKLKLLDEDNNIIENVEPFLNNVDSEQSGNAEVSVEDVEILDNLKSIEVCSYSAWKKDDNNGVEGNFSEKKIIGIDDIEIKEIVHK